MQIDGCDICFGKTRTPPARPAGSHPFPPPAAAAAPPLAPRLQVAAAALPARLQARHRPSRCMRAESMPKLCSLDRSICLPMSLAETPPTLDIYTRCSRRNTPAGPPGGSGFTDSSSGSSRSDGDAAAAALPGATCGKMAVHCLEVPYPNSMAWGQAANVFKSARPERRNP